MGRWQKQKFSREYYIYGLKMIFEKNYGVETDLFDWESEIDFRLTFGENFGQLFEKLNKRGLIRKGVQDMRMMRWY